MLQWQQTVDTCGLIFAKSSTEKKLPTNLDIKSGPP